MKGMSVLNSKIDPIVQLGIVPFMGLNEVPLCAVPRGAISPLFTQSVATGWPMSPVQNFMRSVHYTAQCFPHFLQPKILYEMTNISICCRRSFFPKKEDSVETSISAI